MKLPLVVTKEGLAALVDAQEGRTNSVTIAQVGLTAQPFIMAPTLDGLPGEFARIESVGGEAVADNILHLVARDDSDASYTVTGLGLYTDTGALFAVYSRTAEQGPIFVKSELATFLLAADVVFEGELAGLIEFGDVVFLYPPATETKRGVAELATLAEAAAGVDHERIVTPKGLAAAAVLKSERGVPGGVATLDANGKVPPAQLAAVDSIDTFEADDEAEMLGLPATPGDFARRLDLQKTFVLRAAPPTDLANWVEFLSPGAPVRSVNGKIGDVVLNHADVQAASSLRTITGSGLVKGGGDLQADRTLTVEAATAAEILAGALGDKAMTPAGFAEILATLVRSSRQVLGGGLVSGGGDLTGNRTLAVTPATPAEVAAATRNDVAVTPASLGGGLRNINSPGFLQIPGTPLILQWGGVAVPAFYSRIQELSYSFPIAFPNAAFGMTVSLTGLPDNSDEADEILLCQPNSNSTFLVQTIGTHNAYSFFYIAIGF